MEGRRSILRKWVLTCLSGFALHYSSWRTWFSALEVDLLSLYVVLYLSSISSAAAPSLLCGFQTLFFSSASLFFFSNHMALFIWYFTCIQISCCCICRIYYNTVFLFLLIQGTCSNILLIDQSLLQLLRILSWVLMTSWPYVDIHMLWKIHTKMWLWYVYSRVQSGR